MAKPAKKVGVSYDRVSTVDQAYNRDGSVRSDASPEAQRQRCLDHVKYRAQRSGIQYDIVEHLSDLAYSGKDTNRPEYQRLIDLVASRRIQFIVAAELSRLSRSVIDFLALVSHCEKNNVDLLIIGLDLDTTTPFGKMMVVILVALAQFEREMTGLRVKENALSRLLKDGKINGAGELLGLTRDPCRPGHFLVEPEGLLSAESVMKLFIKLSSKQKVLEMARKAGITGPSGKELTINAIDAVVLNAGLRYRGKWLANVENKDVDPLLLPESKRYQEVALPHGQLLDTKLLDDVERKAKSTRDGRKKSGADGYVYILQPVLFYEDGSSFSGQCAKNRQYRYYHNAKNGIRIQADQLDAHVLAELKTTLTDTSEFQSMLRDAISLRQAVLPKVESQMRTVEAQLQKIEESNQALREQLLDKERRSGPGFMAWLEGEVAKLDSQQPLKRRELDALVCQRDDLRREVGLDDLQRTAKDYLKRFDGLTGIEKRAFIERLVKRITVKPSNRLMIEFYGEPMSAVNGRKKRTERERDGS